MSASRVGYTSTDPRPARSRARLLEAATSLLRTGGPSAVTIDAVTRTANVARATFYRHFPHKAHSSRMIFLDAMRSIQSEYVDAPFEQLSYNVWLIGRGS